MITMPHGTFWVNLDELGNGQFWEQDAGKESFDGEVHSNPETSRRIYALVRELFAHYALRDQKFMTEEQQEEMIDYTPLYRAEFTVHIGQQQITFDTPLLLTLESYPGLKPIVCECAALVNPEAQHRLGLGPYLNPSKSK